MMPVLFQREPGGFWQAAPRERPLWVMVVALAMLALFVAALCVLAVGARADDAKRVETKICHAGVCTVCYVGGDCMVDVPEDTISYPTAGQLTTNKPIPVPCTGCILVDGKWVQTAPPDSYRTRCLPVGSDQIVDCWVEPKHAR